MKWFKKKKKSQSVGTQDIARSSPQFAFHTPPVSRHTLAKVPPAVLERIFAFVCPHASDETFERCENTFTENGCMLCDMRDLAHCAQVSRKWRNEAVKVLYHSIRIDVVHYCPREEVLSEARKRKSFLNRNAEPEDTAAARLRLLARTLYDNRGGLALYVQFLKTPYMTREVCKPDLARSVAVCPKLRYVDLPEGVFTNDPSCNILLQQVQRGCPDLRKMTYAGGAEQGLEMLAGGQLWCNLEVLELSKLNLDPTILRRALGALERLHALKVTDMRSFQDDIFRHSDYLVPFPALSEIILDDTPNITADGLATYLSRHDTQHTLKRLSLTATGVHTSTLQQLLAVAPVLNHLSITESVISSFPAGHVPSLQSKSLKTFHYEITSGSSANAYASITASHYAYLTTSLMSGGLPALSELYVRDPDFPETLLELAPPKPGFATDPDNFVPPRNGFGSPPNQNRFSSNNPFATKMATGPGLKQSLQVYSKGLDEMEWNFSRVQPPISGRRGSATTPRPVSSYGLSDSMGAGWSSPAGGARMSVIVGNGFGGFLAVPSDDGARPSSSAGEKRRGSQYDMWR